jgi:hypothetical protein
MTIKCITAAALISEHGSRNPNRASVTWVDNRRLYTATHSYPCPTMMKLLLQAAHQGVTIQREVWK